MNGPGHDLILSSAVRLLRAHVYRRITVWDISADAGVSPALVMKLFLSKKSFSLRPHGPQLTELGVPPATLGRTLVQ